MHLLAATPGAVEDGKDPVDLGQTPADVIFVSAADTELAALSEARGELAEPPSLRLANLSNLQHPMSVDLHLDQCATKSRLVIARVLGGVGYWKYGAEQFAARLHEAGVPLTLGTDMANPFIAPGRSMAREAVLHHAAGIPAWDILRMATSNAARTLGIADRTGALAVGQEADIVFLSADPATDLNALIQVRAVLSDGALHDPETLLADQ